VIRNNTQQFLPSAQALLADTARGKPGTRQTSRPWLQQPIHKRQHLPGHARWKTVWLSQYKSPEDLISRCAGTLGKGCSWTFSRVHLNLESVSPV